jgi:hypothetical protein
VTRTVDTRRSADQSDKSLGFIGTFCITWGIIAAVIAVLWGIAWLMAGAFRWNYREQFGRGTMLDFQRYLMPHDIFHATSPYYMLSLVFLVITATIAVKTKPKSSLVFGLIIMLALGSTVQMVRGMWDNDKDGGRSYLAGTAFIVPDLNSAPASLEKMLDGAKDDEGNGCAKVGKHDVASCINEGVLKQSWQVRNGSASGATYVLKRTGGGVSNTSVMDDTITYVYTDGGGHWTAIRDGRDKTPLYGIISWDGRTQNATSCRFTGKYALNRAFAGQWGRSLKDELAGKYPNLMFELNDAWGYCGDVKNGDTKVDKAIEPIIVIPMYRQISFNQRTTLVPAGVVKIQGSSSGNAVYTRYANVKAGDFPGPVYPVSIVARQRQALEWAASRGVKNNNKFGFEPIDADIGSGNTSEYFLTDTKSGRRYWVTPMAPKGSNTQEADAYSITAADEVADGALNQQLVYVLADGSPSIARLNDLATTAATQLTRSYPGFLQSGGAVAEMTPVDNDTWQVIVDFKGRQKFSMMMDLTDQSKVVITDLDATIPVVGGSPNTGSSSSGSGPSTTPSAGSEACNKPVSQMSRQELQDCGVAIMRRLSESKAA